MSEETKDVTAENVSAPEPQSVEEAPSSEVSAETPSSREGETAEQVEAQEKINSSQPTDEPDESNDSDDQPKETRAERRIRQLVDKNKNLSKQIEDLSSFSSQDTPFAKGSRNEPLITEQDMQEGIDPAVLEQRVEERMRKAVQQELAQRDQIARYQKDVDAAISDLEATVKSTPELDEESESYDPVFAEAFLNIYNDANYSNNAFIPRRKASEIASSLKGLTERVATKRAAEVSTKVAAQAQEGAVRPEATSSDSANYEYEEALQRATRTGRNEDWAKVLKLRTSRN